MAAKAKPSQSTPASSRNYYILIAALSILIYANTFNHGFVLDDTAVIENNRFVKQGIGGIPEILQTFYWEGYWDSNAGLYRPLSLVTFAIEYQLSPENPVIHHLFNVLFYAIACCLLFEFLCRAFERIDRRFFLFATLLFVLHPIHTEVVANVKSRDEILSLLFFLLSCRYLYVDIPSVKNTILGSLFFLFALLSKEGAILFLPVVFLLDYIKEKNVLIILRQRAALLIASLCWFAWHRYIITSSASPRISYTYADNSLFASSSLLDQKATAFGMFVKYIIKSFYPYQLSYDYSFSQVPIISFASLPAIAGVLIFAAFIYIAWKYFPTEPLITFCIAMIVLPLCLTGNLFFNIGATMADRFLFIPTIGSCIIICWVLFRIFKADPTGKSVPPLSIQYSLIALMLLYSVRTFTRNKDWKDNFTLFKKDVNASPNSARAHYNNALALQMTSGDEGLNASRKEYELSLKIDPKYKDAMINLGAVYTKQKEYPSALTLYRRALAMNPADGNVLGNMGDAFYRSGNNDSAIYYLKKAQLAGNRTAGTYNVLGTALFGKQDYPQALSVFEEGIRNDSTDWSLYLNYGNALAISNRFADALKAFHRSYEKNPSNAQTVYFIALTYLKLGDTLSSDKYFTEYKRINK